MKSNFLLFKFICFRLALRTTHDLKKQRMIIKHKEQKIRTESKTFKVYIKINMLNNEIKAFFSLANKSTKQKKKFVNAFSIILLKKMRQFMAVLGFQTPYKIQVRKKCV